ncbi:hypothetical protein [Streptomyces sp. NPDC015414]|uniref:hypothetical protein n=1 Tax=Streptomyces sp. NPDC015414 TaxID=3364957 RepID=UPI0036FBAA8E
MIFKLPSGHRVRSTNLGGDLVDFETRNASGETISTVRQSGAQAGTTLSLLRAADSIRFAAQYGGGIR